MKTQNPEITIIIVNWNGIRFLPNCIKSIVENPPSVSYEIVLVDNDSSDKSVEWLKSDEAREILKNIKFTLIESRENLGFGKANNMAIEKTFSPFLFILNPDTTVTKNSIDTLVKTLESEKKIGMVAPKLVGADGKNQKNAWAFPGATKILLEGLKITKLIPLRYKKKWLLSGSWDYSDKRDVPMVSGAAMLVKRKMIDEVGAFDSKIFMYGEDTEWCVRIGRSGWRIVLEPNAEVVHLGGQSSIQMWGANETRLKEETANLRFQQDCFSPFQVLKNTSARIFVLSLHYLLSIIRRRDNDLLRNLLFMQINGFKKALKDLH